ncbi:DsbE family thiol:disulfide interchange protein [Stakelama sediminis]
MKVRHILLWLPLVLFAVLMIVVATGVIRPNTHAVRSHMTGKPVPAFTLSPMVPGKPGLSTTDFIGHGPRLLNVFGSWCVPCAAEAGELQKLKALGVPVEGVAIRDKPQDVQAFLARYGDPYDRIGDDSRARVQLAMGSSGVPESFLIDGKGRIVLQHIGAIRADDIPGIIAAWKAAQ